MASAHGFWVGSGDQQRLCWQIDGEFVSDKALRAWVWHNMTGVSRYVDVMRAYQTEAYSNRHRSTSGNQ